MWNTNKIYQFYWNSIKEKNQALQLEIGNEYFKCVLSKIGLHYTSKGHSNQMRKFFTRQSYSLESNEKNEK